jgi:serine/threonine protein kinase
MAFQLGESVGPYRIVEQLGQGGMATVYKAYHASLDRDVAIKILHPSLKEDENFYARFQREAQIVAKLQHPHIVPVFDFAMERNEPYIVMKYITGQTLKSLLKRQHLSLEETLKILPSVADALTYAHNRGILHRDVKPSNIMVDNDNTPYLADFGLARIASSGESTMSQDVLIGTPNYISPEQARGDKDLGPATDIYSLGIVLYEIVVGRVPFTADTPYAVVHDHIYKPLPIPSHVNPTVPPALEHVLLKALSKDPLDRYPSAIALMEAFQEAVVAAQVTELSAASVKMERFEDTATNNISSPTTSTPTPPSSQDINNMVRAALTEALAARTSDSAIPPVMSPGAAYAYTQALNSSAPKKRRSSSRRSFWLLSGCAALVFICIASLGIIMNALQNPIIQSNPALLDSNALVAQPNATATEVAVRALTAADLELNLEDGLAMLEENPDDALVNLLVSFRYLELQDQDQALVYLLRSINSPDATGEMFAQAARLTASAGFTESAILLWLTAYQFAPNDPAIRNDAGQYLYRQVNSIQLAEVPSFLQVFEDQNSNALTQIMIAQAIISSGERFNSLTRLEQAQTLLDRAQSEGSVAPETNLVYGNYYALNGDQESAIEAWEYARSFVDAPEWVMEEASFRLRQLEGENP